MGRSKPKLQRTRFITSRKVQPLCQGLKTTPTGSELTFPGPEPTSGKLGWRIRNKPASHGWRKRKAAAGGGPRNNSATLKPAALPGAELTTDNGVITFSGTSNELRTSGRMLGSSEERRRYRWGSGQAILGQLRLGRQDTRCRPDLRARGGTQTVWQEPRHGSPDGTSRTKPPQGWDQESFSSNWRHEHGLGSLGITPELGSVAPHTGDLPLDVGKRHYYLFPLKPVGTAQNY